MPHFSFILLSFLWLADLAAMVALGHLSNYLTLFCILYCLAFVLLLALVSRFPEHLDDYRAFLLMIILGFTGRAIFLFYPPGNDIYRYIWEGYIQNHGFNPYIYAPDDPALSAIANGKMNPIWESINHKSFSAIYPPLTLLVLRLLAGLKPDPMLFKIFMVFMDVGLMIVLALIIKIRKIPVRQLLLYACNPLVIVFIAGEGHLDGIQAFFLFMAIFFFVKRKGIAGFLLLGLSAIIKYFTVVAIPFWVTGKNRLKWLIVFLPLIFYIPFSDAGSNVAKSLYSYGANLHYNDSIFTLLRWLFGNSALLVGIILILIGLAWIFLFVQDPLRSVYLACGLLLVFLPTLHPWYLILIAPFMVFFSSKAWLWLQLAMVFTFPVLAIDYQTGVFQEIHWLKIFAYVPFYILVIWGLFRNGQLFNQRRYSGPTFVSVVIPTLNESKELIRILTSLQNQEALKEVIVADGGSMDDTCELAEEYNARVVQGRAGRGFQIKAGVETATGDVLLILHADCIAPEGLLANIIGALKANPHVAGGACRMSFENIHFKTRMVAGLNNLRTRLTGISFGDQAQFFRIEALDQLGGFPKLMLMEDVELSVRLKQTGRLLFLKDRVAVSSRRWMTGSFARNFLKVIRLFVLYLIERRLGLIREFGHKYYIDYYFNKRRVDEGITE
jgi:rSAM/selenodomain-associated transferase 2